MVTEGIYSHLYGVYDMRCSICHEEIGGDWGTIGYQCEDQGKPWHNREYARLVRELDNLGFAAEGYERNKHIEELGELLRLKRGEK